MSNTSNNKPSAIRWKLKTGDSVRVLRGRDRGKKGKILALLPAEGRVMVEGINMVKKHVRAKRQGQKGQRVSVPAPLAIGNVQVICPQCKKGTRISITRENQQRQRLCKKCNAVIN